MLPLREAYLEIDRRLLAVFRVYLSLVLLADLASRARLLTLLYTNDGALPNHDLLFRFQAHPVFSLYALFSTKPEVTLAFAMTAVVYALLLVGYRTKLAQLLAAICISSLVARNPFIEMGATSAMTLAAWWTLFLPLGDRFSVDALTRRLAARVERRPSELDDLAAVAPDRTPHASIVVLGLYLQIAAIYFFNFAQKLTPRWIAGEAVHWVLWQNRLATPVSAWLRMHEPGWFSPLASYGTLALEAIGPIMILTPIGWRWTRSIYFVLTVSLHTGIALLVDVGAFSYIMFAFDLLLLPGFWFDRAEARLARRRGAVPLRFAYEPTDAGLHFFARVLSRVTPPGTFRFEALAPHDEAGRLPLALRTPEGTTLRGEVAARRALRAVASGVLAIPPFVTLVLIALRHRERLARGFAWPAGSREDADPAAASPAPVMVEPRARRLARVYLREGLGAVFAFTAMTQILHDNFWLKGKIPEELRTGPPGWLAAIPTTLRQFQIWSMFPEAPLTDGTLIVDGVTRDGRHLDPFTRRAPDYDAVIHGPLRYGHLMCRYFAFIGIAASRRDIGNLEHYLSSWQELTHRPARDELVSFSVFWVEVDSPPPGSTRPSAVRRRLVLRHDAGL